MLNYLFCTQNQISYKIIICLFDNYVGVTIFNRLLPTLLKNEFKWNSRTYWLRDFGHDDFDDEYCDTDNGSDYNNYL